MIIYDLYILQLQLFICLLTQISSMYPCRIYWNRHTHVQNTIHSTQYHSKLLIQVVSYAFIYKTYCKRY